MEHCMNFGFFSKDPAPANGRRVAVIGAGPSGLAAAGYLACQGYSVDVYDKMPKAGGLMVFGIPGYRIPAERVECGVEHLRKQYGVKFHMGTKIAGGTPMNEETGDQFSENVKSLGGRIEDHDAVLLCTGTWRSRKMNIPGENLPGVYSSLEFLFPIRAAQYDTNRMHVIGVEGKRVAVIGAGHSAVDVVRGALAHGASEVHLLYRRTVNECPCGRFEIEEAVKAGARWMELVSPTRVLGSDKVEGLELVKKQLGPPDEKGRACPLPGPGEEMTLPVDIVVTAIGEIPTAPFASELGLENVRKGEVHFLQMTKLDGVFVAGDALTGPSKIGKAIYSGLRAAQSLTRWLDLKAQDRENEYSDENDLIRREDMVAQR